eukprot:g798.t1
MLCRVSTPVLTPCLKTGPVRRVLRPVHAERSEGLSERIRSAHYGALAVISCWPLLVDKAVAKEGEYGILEGTTIALLHPLVMIGLFGSTLYAGYLGWQWRRLREIGTEIKVLKSQVPKTDEDGETPKSPLNAKIAELELNRKELTAGGFRDRHFNLGSILLGGGIFTAVFGCVNTYTRTGKLFPGPHLFAGAGIVVLWAVAASLVPSMQKGNENARTAHIALNALNVILFAWQVPTGLEIVGKVFENTKFP